MKYAIRYVIDVAALCGLGLLAYQQFGLWGMALAQMLGIGYSCWCFWDGLTSS